MRLAIILAVFGTSVLVDGQELLDQTNVTFCRGLFRMSGDGPIARIEIDGAERDIYDERKLSCVERGVCVCHER